MQILLPVYILLALGNEWYWWFLTLVFYFLYLVIGNNITMHRYFSHRYFSVRRSTEWFMAWCSTMACLGSPLSFVNVHNVHHQHYETILDPHGRARGWRSMLFWFHKHLTPCDMIFSRQLVRLVKSYKLLHDYYWLWVFACAGLMYYIGGWKVLLFCWLLPASLCLWAVALVLLLQHDEHGPSNTRNYMWFSFGETWHKNHHHNPALDDHSDPGDIDWTYQMTKLLRKSK